MGIGAARRCGEAQNDDGAKDRIGEVAGLPADTAKPLNGFEGAERLVLEGSKRRLWTTKEPQVAPAASRGRWRWGSWWSARTVASCRCLAARLKKRSAANVSQTLKRTEWKTLLKRLPRTLAEYVAKERIGINLHMTPLSDPSHTSHPCGVLTEAHTTSRVAPRISDLTRYTRDLAFQSA